MVSQADSYRIFCVLLLAPTVYLACISQVKMVEGCKTYSSIEKCLIAPSVNSVVHNIGSSQVATVERDNIGKGKQQSFKGSTFCSRNPLESRLKLSNSLFHFFTMGLRM